MRYPKFVVYLIVNGAKLYLSPVKGAFTPDINKACVFNSEFQAMCASTEYEGAKYEKVD